MGRSRESIDASFVEIVAGFLPEDDPPFADAEGNIWFVLDPAEAEKYLLVAFRDLVAGGGRYGAGLSEADEGSFQELREVHLALYMLMTGRARTVAMTCDGRIVPHGVDWSALREDRDG